MEPDILEQLVWIKWLFVLSLVIFLIVVGTIIALLIATFRGMRQFNAGHGGRKDERVSLQDKTSELFYANRSEEALVNAADWASKYPGDASARWYLAHIYHRLDRPHEALSAMRKARELCPGWNGTDEFIESLEEGILDSGSPESRESPPENDIDPKTD